MENIKNFILEGEEEFDKEFTEVSCECGARDLFDFSKVKQFISSRQISLIKMIMEMVESGKKEVYFLNYKEDSIENAENRGNNQALNTISSKLSSLVNGEK